jgi:hypothetical protein
MQHGFHIRRSASNEIRTIESYTHPAQTAITGQSMRSKTQSWSVSTEKLYPLTLARQVDLRLAIILLKLLRFEEMGPAVKSEHEGTFRWLPVLKRLTDSSNPHSSHISDILTVIEAETRTQKALLSGSTFQDELAQRSAYSAVYDAIEALKLDDADAKKLTRDYLKRRRSMSEDLLALRWLLGDADWTYLMNCMPLSRSERELSFYDRCRIWLSRSRLFGYNLTV